MSVERFQVSVWQPRVRWSFWALVLLATAVAAGARPDAASAQDNGARKTTKDDDELPAAQEETLTTLDGVKLAATYYPGTKGKESVPVVLLHGAEGSRKDYSDLAPLLQENLGCAVLVPDLRGHGDSPALPAGRTGNPNPTVQLALAKQDLLAIKTFLWKRNNAEELNIDKTCLIGADMGAALVLEYALLDSMGYEQKTASYGPLKLGCFVKAMVLISPPWTYKNMKAIDALKSPYVRASISTLILVGKQDTKAGPDARKIKQQLDRYHPKPEKKEQQTLFMPSVDTSLQGTKMLGESSLSVPQLIEQFISVRLVKNSETKAFAWKERKRPHE